jgi:hypothetical protein
MKKIQTKLSLVMVLATVLLTGVAQAQWRNGGNHTIVNGEEVPIRISTVKHIHCFANELLSNVPIAPGGKLVIPLYHPGDWRGCDNVYASFSVIFDPAVGKATARTFYFFPNKSGAIGASDPKVGEGNYPGDLVINGREMTLTTKAGLAGPKKAQKILPNEMVIVDYMDGNRSSNSAKTVRLSQSESEEIEKQAKIEASLEVGYEGMGASAKATLVASMEKKLKQAKTKEKEEMISERGSWKMEPGRIKIGIIMADIYEAPDGTVYAKQTSNRITYREYDMKADREEMQQLVGNLSKEGAIGLLPGLKLASPWGGKSNLLKVESRTIAGQPVAPPVQADGMNKGSMFAGIPANIQAACENGKGTAYFFQGANYWRFYPNTGKVEGPIAISSGWAGLPDNLDAAVNGTNGKFYFFKNGAYWRWDIASDTLDEGHPKAISAGWAGLPNRLDGAMQVPGTKNLVFFAGDKVWTWDMSTDTLGSNSPRSASGDFPNVPQPIDACSTLGGSTSVFFQGRNKWSKSR